MGDLNCHLGHLGGSRSTEEPNHRGVLWKELLDRHSVFVASLGALSMGPIHTYSSGDHSTTPDYVIGNVALAEMLQSCETLDDDPLNTSDHLPILTKLASQHQPPSQEAPKKPVRLNWDLAARDGSALTYAAQVEAIINPLLEKDYSSIDEIEADLLIVSKAMVSISSSIIPHVKSSNLPQGKRHIKDAFLSHLCWLSRVAFREWKAAGHPSAGPAYEKRKECKRKVSEHLSKCRARLERKAIQRCDNSQSNHPL